MKPRREEPKCMHGFDFIGGRCSKVTEEDEYNNALSACWAGWQLQDDTVQVDVAEWIRKSVDRMTRTRYATYTSMVWLPVSRPNRAASLHTPIWTWKAADEKWMPNVRSNVRNSNEGYSEDECAAFDLKSGKVVAQSCKTHLPMVCDQPTLRDNISAVISSEPDHIGEYFCPSGWITHVLAMDSELCYTRLTMPEAVTWDEAREECIRQGGDLAMAPTHSLRIALEQVYAFFNNQSIVDSWIGIRNPGSKPGVLRWANETIGTPPSETYVWQPYNEFGVGYGVSTGLTRMWWNWPRDTRVNI